MNTNPDMLFLPYRLKEISRKGGVGNRFESTAEHVYSCMTLASYYIKFHPELNYERVMKILLFHDLVEIFAGDTFILDDNMIKTKKVRENKAFEKLLQELPLETAGELKIYWPEFENGLTKEARFCKAIESLDPMIHSLYNPEEWTKYKFTERELINKKEIFFKEFPEIHKMFKQVINRLKSNGSIR